MTQKKALFDFGWRLGESNGANRYTCPACKAPGALTVNMDDQDDIRFLCSHECSQADILGALDVAPSATIYMEKIKLVQPVQQQAKKPPKEKLTWEMLVGELASRGWSVAFNVVSQEVEISARTTFSKRNMGIEDLATVLYSDLSNLYKGCSLDTLHAYLNYIAREYAYNPVLDYLNSLEWDGVDRTEQLFSLMGIAESDTLSRTLIFKWLLQCVAMIYNTEENPCSPEGVLVLTGKQGICKSNLFKRLAVRPAWYHNGDIKSHDKDTRRRCCTYWITELQEVERTLKTDPETLKAFVTESVDVYRTTYARADRRVARRTTLCASANSTEFLADTTGNRRWWTVPITKRMEFQDVDAFAVDQLWAQIHFIVKDLSEKERAACFRLNQKEQEDLEARNTHFEKPIKAESECRDLIEEANERGCAWELMTITEWKAQNMEVLRSYSVQQIGAALKKIGIEAERTETARMRRLPSMGATQAKIHRIK